MVVNWIFFPVSFGIIMWISCLDVFLQQANIGHLVRTRAKVPVLPSTYKHYIVIGKHNVLHFLGGIFSEFRCEISHKRIIKNTWLGDYSDLKHWRVMLIIYGASDQILFFEFPYIKVEKGQCDHLLLWRIDALLTSVLVSFFRLFPSDIFALISHLHCPMMDVVTVNDVDLQGYKYIQPDKLLHWTCTCIILS